ncbi:MAG: hypothetical protein K0R02_354 [Rickettsiaceae bacterium]|nr:hypothetical protein [Rickettsiaceae bacterium]
MGIRLTSNNSFMAGQLRLQNSTSQLQASIQRLLSGYRITDLARPTPEHLFNQLVKNLENQTITHLEFIPNFDEEEIEKNTELLKNALKANKSLKYITIDNFPILQFLSVLTNHPAIESLLTYKKFLLGKDSFAIWNFIKSLSKLTSLAVHDSSFLRSLDEENYFIKELTSTIYSLSSLQKLEINISGKCMPQKLISDFGTVLRNSKIVDLKIQVLDNKIITEIAEILKNSIYLKTLELKVIKHFLDPFIYYTDTSPLAESLKVNKTLNCLEIYKDIVSIEEAQIFAEILKTNETLRQFRLCGISLNSLSFDSLDEILGSVFEKNFFLQELKVASDDTTNIHIHYFQESKPLKTYAGSKRNKEICSRLKWDLNIETKIALKALLKAKEYDEHFAEHKIFDTPPLPWVALELLHKYKTALYDCWQAHPSLLYAKESKTINFNDLYKKLDDYKNIHNFKLHHVCNDIYKQNLDFIVPPKEILSKIYEYILPLNMPAKDLLSLLVEGNTFTMRILGLLDAPEGQTQTTIEHPAENVDRNIVEPMGQTLDDDNNALI